VRYYICAALALPIGAGLGATLARDPVEPWHGRLVVAHITLNMLGWIGLTIMGTLVTLWPTMLRTRIAESAERVARQALPILVGSVVVTVAGALAGQQTLAAVGAAAYLGGVLWAARPLAQVTRAKAPSAYATWSVMAGVLWLVGSLIGLVAVLVFSPTWTVVTDRLGLLVIPLAAGFVAQVLLGALSYLVPVVLGGGPAIVRGTQARLERGNALRVVLINAGLMICVLPVPSLVRVLVSMLVLGGFAAFLPLLATTVVYAVRAKRDVRQSAAEPTSVSRHVPEAAALVRGRHTGLAATALALIVMAVAGGAALDPAALGIGVARASDGVIATGQVTTVKVVAGAANNILLEERHGDELERRGIVYAVDYVANSGGTIYDTDRLRKGGFQPERALAKVREIYGRTQEVFAIAERDGIPCYQAADRLAEARIAALTAVKLLG